MADKSVNVRIGVDGGDKTKRDLAGVGSAGQDALDRIAKATTPASRALSVVGNAAASLNDRFAALGARLGGVGTALTALGGPAGTVAAAGLVAVAGSAALAAVGVRKAVGLIADQTQMAIEKFDALDDSAQRIGIDAEKFQALAFAFEGVGVKSEQLEKSLTKFGDTVGDALLKGSDAPKETISTFTKLGIKLSDLQKAGGDIGVLLPRIADGLTKVKTQSERVNLARNLFGKEGAALLPQLMQGRNALEEMVRYANEVGAVLGPKVVSKLSEAGDKLAAIRLARDVQGGRVGAAFADIGVAVESEKLRVIKTLLDRIEIADRSGAFAKFRDGIIANVSKAAEGVIKAFDEIIAKQGGLDGFFNSISASIDKFTKDLVGGEGSASDFAAAVKSGVAEAAAAFSNLGVVVGGIADTVRFLRRAEDIKVPNIGNIAGSAVNRTIIDPLIGKPARYIKGLFGGDPATQQTPITAPLATNEAPRVRTPASTQAPPGYSHQIGGALDVNIKSPLPVKVRARPVNPNIPINVNQGMNASTP